MPLEAGDDYAAWTLGVRPWGPVLAPGTLVRYPDEVQEGRVAAWSALGTVLWHRSRPDPDDPRKETQRDLGILWSCVLPDRDNMRLFRSDDAPWDWW